MEARSHNTGVHEADADAGAKAAKETKKRARPTAQADDKDEKKGSDGDEAKTKKKQRKPNNMPLEKQLKTDHGLKKFAKLRAKQDLAQRIFDATGVDLRVPGIQLLELIQNNMDHNTLARSLIVHGTPKLPATHELDIVFTDGVSVNLVFGVDEPSKPDKDADEDGGTVTNNAEDHLHDGKVTFSGDRRSPSTLLEQHIITADPGVREVTMVLTPKLVVEVLQHAVNGTLAQMDNFEAVVEADDAAKVRGNRQLSANVYATVARTKQHRAMEKEALRQADKSFKRAGARILPSSTQEARQAMRVPAAAVAAVAQAAPPPPKAVRAEAAAKEVEQFVTVKLLQDSLVDLARAITRDALLAAIKVRAQAAGSLLFAYYKKAFRQVRRDKTLRDKRFAEQVARSIQDLARHPEEEGQLWRKEKVQIGPFGDQTRLRQQQGEMHERPKKIREEAPLPLGDVVLVNGNRQAIRA